MMRVATLRLEWHIVELYYLDIENSTLNFSGVDVNQVKDILESRFRIYIYIYKSAFKI